MSQKPENWGTLSGKDVDTEEKEEIVWNTPEEHGKYLFTNQGCSGCHSLTDKDIVGPGMQGILGKAATRVSGLTAEEYIYNSIVSPNEYMVEGYPENVMPQTFGNLSEEELNALISYLKTIE
ncbi:MAG: hypothetical protein CL506_02020 [Actinobacteria bacterium]|nr:hypothetical protein [Actinomycetota bacterium]